MPAQSRPGQPKPSLSKLNGPKHAVKTRTAHATVTVAKSRLSEADQELTRQHMLQAMDVGDNPASVNVAVNLTHNLGHYESLRVSVGVTMPCRPSQIYQAAEAARLIAQDILDVSSDEWLGTANGRRSPSYDQAMADPQPAATSEAGSNDPEDWGEPA